ncbi:MAG: hypothetical protein ACK55Z_33795, partial [bacterium]
ILYRNTGNPAIEQQMHKSERILGQLRVAQTPRRPMHPARAQIGAGRERDHHVPPLGQEIAHIPTIVLAGGIARLKIAAPSIPALASERITHPPAVLTSHKHTLHWPTPFGSPATYFHLEAISWLLGHVKYGIFV